MKQIRGAHLEDRSELVVALFRMAFLLSLLFARAVAERERDDFGLGPDIIVALACFYNLGILIAYWRELHFRHEREVTVGVDLALVTLCVSSTGGIASPLVPLYYMVVIVAGYWFELYGAAVTAMVASGLYLGVVVLDGSAPGVPVQRFLMALFGSVPFIFLIALIVGYMSRAIRAEQQRAARHDQELAMARRIQQELLSSSLPPTPGFDIAYRIEPASEIGGDYFDVIALGPGRVGICIADVAGRSISAAQHLSLFKFIIHAAAPGAKSSGDLARRVNEVLIPHLQADMFIAMFYGILDVASGRLEYVNAGHTPPLLCDGKTGAFEELVSGGIVLGALPEPRYRSRTRTLRVGQMLVLCTDGVETARDDAGELFGSERVMEAVKSAGDASAQAVANAIVAGVKVFTQGDEEDDLTVAVVRVHPAGVAEGSDKA